jgi:NTE family protein
MADDDSTPCPTPPVPPVQDTPGEPAKPSPGIALSLSGGGYRAMLFHLGSLWRLNEFCYLPKLNWLSSVSGGSITSATLAQNWSKLGFDANGRAANFEQQVTQPLRKMAGKTIDAPSLFEGFIEGASNVVAQHYKTYLFGDTTLQNLPDEPTFLFNATSLQTGVLWRFCKAFMGDYKVGLINNPTVPLAKVVAASSAFPPVLSPATFDLDPDSFDPAITCGPPFNTPAYRSKAVLCDGGVYDNLGLETTWKHYTEILVSDGGIGIAPDPDPNHLWPQQIYRVLSIIYNQVAALRKRNLVASYKCNERSGTYWGIQANIAKYKLANALVCDFALTTRLAQTPTRLDAMDDRLQEQLIDWGYAICDAAMRKHVLPPDTPAPKQSPYGMFKQP